MSYSIRIREKTGEGPWLFEQHFPSKEAYERVAQKCINKKVFWESVFIPARIAPFEGLCRDLFIPATYFVTVVCKDAISKLARTGPISELALRILFTFGALISDCLTLPIRLVTLIPRLMMGDAKRECHPFHKYLVEERADERILNTDQVALRLEWEKEGINPHRATEFLEESFHFIRLPPSENDGTIQKGSLPNAHAAEILRAELVRLAAQEEEARRLVDRFVVRPFDAPQLRPAPVWGQPYLQPQQRMPEDRQELLVPEGRIEVIDDPELEPAPAEVPPHRQPRERMLIELVEE